MKILFCSQYPLDRRLGVPKALLELADEFERLGWRCHLASDEEICPGVQRYRGTRWLVESSRALGAFLERNATRFDVVDYDYRFLPFQRRRFSSSTLMVARVPLLVHHFEKTRLPRMNGFRSWVGARVKGPVRHLETKLQIALANRALEAADLVNVSNDDDRRELVSRNFDPEKIAVLPLGLAQARIESFQRTPPELPKQPRIAFIGTFDPRKGGADFPDIVDRVTKIVPECKFRLLGSRYLGETEVLNYFPRRLHRSLEIRPKFEPEELPLLLGECSLGIFPSYVEGFGFAVAEMLAASLPVIAYDAPGPPMMLPPDYLVPRGATEKMAQKVTTLLRNDGKLVAARVWARARAAEFTWQRVARVASDVYAEQAARLRAARKT